MASLKPVSKKIHLWFSIYIQHKIDTLLIMHEVSMEKT